MENSFENAIKDSNASLVKKENLYFIDDSEINVKAASKFGWGKIIQYVELEADLPTDLNTYPALNIHIVRSILDIKKVYPDLFPESIFLTNLFC